MRISSLVFLFMFALAGLPAQPAGVRVPPPPRPPQPNRQPPAEQADTFSGKPGIAIHFLADSLPGLDSIVVIQATRALEAIGLGDKWIKKQSGKGGFVFDAAGLDSALQMMEVAIRVSQQQHDSLRMRQLQRTMGKVQQQSGYGRFAMESYQKALQIAERSGDLEGQAQAWSDIGEVHLENQNDMAALRAFERSVALYERLEREKKGSDYSEALSRLHVNIGKCYQHFDQHEEAMRYFDRARVISEEGGRREEVSEVYTNIGAFYEQRKDWENAIIYHKRALAGFDSVENKYGMVVECNSLGKLFLEQGDLERAEVYLQEGLAGASQIGAVDQAAEASLALYKSAERKGDKDLAWKYYQQYVQLKDSLSKEENQRKLAVLENRFEAEQREAELNRLARENAENELQLQRARNLQYLSFAGSGLLLLLVFGVWQRQRNLRQRQRIALEEERIVQLEQIDRLKDEFLANTSHELRTPLTGIIGLAESLSGGVAGPLPEAAVTNLDMIVNSGRRLSNLVNDILDFSRLKTRELTLQLQPVDLYAAAEVVLALSRPLVEGKNVALVNDVPRDLPPVQADENRLQQILHNLVGNAIKFTEQGRIGVAATLEEGQAVVSVSDTGIGIPPDKHDLVFRSFEQVSSGDEEFRGDARLYGGTGLGLTITRQLVELHGGTIGLRSEVGEGSTFRFTLPLSGEAMIPAPEPLAATLPAHLPIAGESLSDDKAVPEEALPLAPSAGPDERVRILIVDDEPVNLQVLQNHLSLKGYEVVKAGSGAQALEILAEDRDFDLIILDIMMPRMTGYEVCQRLRKFYSPTDLPIVMLTAKNRVQDLVEGFDVGANDYLTKPFSRDELLSRIQTHLRLRSIHRASGKFVPFEFLRSLGRETITDVRLGDQTEKRVTVYFSDIRDYTALAETMSPTDNFQFVFSLNERMGPIIRQQHGFVNQYLGDAIMAIFPENPADALRAAIAMQRRLQVYNEERRQRGRKPIRIGIGMHTGPLIMGVIGDHDRLDAATISDTVNTASRIENLTKYYGAKILVSEACLLQPDPAADAGTDDLAASEFHLRYLGQVQVKGRREPVGVYECFDGDLPDVREKKLATLADFEDGMNRYLVRDFRGATEAFRRVLAHNNEDQVARILLEHADTYARQGVPDGWTGVEIMSERGF